MSIFTKKFKVLGRSKTMTFISDFIFLLLITCSLGYYTYSEIQKLQLQPIIINTINKVSNNENKELIVKNPEEIKCSDIKVNSYALYYNKYGDQLGIGPIPPAVGIPTNYWIFFEIQNGENTLKAIDLYMDLPSNVSFTGNKNVKFGNFIINANKQISWSALNIEKNQNIKFAFEISITPNEANLGEVLNLIENTKLFAKDELCKKQIQSTIKNIDTNLPYDTKAKGQGKIINLQ